MNKDELNKRLEQFTDYALENDVTLTKENFTYELNCFCKYGMTSEILRQSLQDEIKIKRRRNPLPVIAS